MRNRGSASRWPAAGSSYVRRIRDNNSNLSAIQEQRALSEPARAANVVG